MEITVNVKNGRLIVRRGDYLVIDKGGDFVDALTNGRFIVALLKSGRVQELRLDGNFSRDIAASGGAAIQLNGDVVTVKTSTGSFEQYKNGRKFSSTWKEPSTKKKHKPSEAERLGEQFADMLITVLGNALRSIYTKIKVKAR